MEMGSGKMNVFQLLVTGVIAIAFLALVFQVILPIFAGGSVSLSDEMTKQLNVAQTQPGKATSSTFNFKAGETYNARNLDSSARSVKFECNLPEICCQDASTCNKPFLITPEVLSIKQNIQAVLSSTCQFENNLYVCQVIIGKEIENEIS